MATLSTARTEKNNENLIAERRNKKINENIQYLQELINQEKEAIKECVDMNMISFIPRHVAQIEKLQLEIHDLQK